MKNVGWKIGKGNIVSFWFDKWSPLPEPLTYYSSNNDIVLHETVNHYSSSSGRWNIDRISHFLPSEVVKQLVNVIPPDPKGQEDVIWWRASSDGNFSIKSAYNWIEKRGTLPSSSVWEQIWKLPTYEKIKTFLWKAVGNRLQSKYTNVNASGTVVRNCSFGCNSYDSAIHILRDCPNTKCFWIKLIKSSKFNSFFSLSLQDWISWNIKQDIGRQATIRIPWKKLFAHVCWAIWKDRCKRLYSEDSTHNQNITFTITQSIIEDNKIQALKNSLLHYPSDEALNRWIPPHDNWLRLDVDGSVLQNSQATLAEFLGIQTGIGSLV